MFYFRPQRMSYELLYRKTFAEIFCPDTVYDLVNYHLSPEKSDCRVVPVCILCQFHRFIGSPHSFGQLVSTGSLELIQWENERETDEEVASTIENQGIWEST